MHRTINFFRNSCQKLEWKRIVFLFIVLAFLGLLGLLSTLLFLPDWLGWLPYNIADKISAMEHLTSTTDVIHELVFSLIIGTAAVGMITQLRKPSENIAGQLMALIAWFAWLIASFITNNWVPFILILIFGGLTLLATILHPKGAGLFSWFNIARVNRTRLLLITIVAVPLLLLAVININLQKENMNIHQQNDGGKFISIFGHKIPMHGEGTETDQLLVNESIEHDHSAIGHFKNMVAFSFIIILVGLLASLQPIGWWLTVWVTGFLPILLGFASLLFPENSASLSLIWGIVAIVWGISFIASDELTKNAKASK